jgi:hypothetical protein
MFAVISFLNSYYNENKEDIINYLIDNLEEGVTIYESQLDELSNQTIVKFYIGDINSYHEILDNFLFDVFNDVVGNLIICFIEKFYEEMNEFGYLDKIIEGDYKIVKCIDVPGECVYIILSEHNYDNLEKLLILNEYFYYNNSGYEENYVPIKLIPEKNFDDNRYDED